MTLAPFPKSGRYRIVAIGPDGTQDRGIGRRFVSINDNQIDIHERRHGGPVLRSATAVSAVQTSRKVWEIATDDGQVLRLTSGCGCGG